MKQFRNTNPSTNPSAQNGSLVMQILVGLAVAVVLIAIVATMMKSAKQKKHLVEATRKMQAIGDAFKGYVEDANGKLPLEDAPGRDDWHTAASPEAVEVWYNVLPKRLGAKPVSALGDSPAEFYAPSYPLFLAGAPYPKTDKKLSQPYFAFAMNSRLQRRSEDGAKPTGNYASIVKPESTVVFLERGLPGDEKVSKIQGGFDAGAKANPANFAARHNQKGLLVFADGHVEAHALSDLVDKSGRIPMPQDPFIWTADPDANPN